MFQSPDDTKTTDADSLRTTFETLVMSHYPHMKGKVHVHRVVCGSELSGTVSSLKSLSPSFGSFHPSLALLLASSPPFSDVNHLRSTSLIRPLRLLTALFDKRTGFTSAFSTPRKARPSTVRYLRWATALAVCFSTKPSLDLAAVTRLCRGTPVRCPRIRDS